jgi:hypothetical protein
MRECLENAGSPGRLARSSYATEYRKPAAVTTLRRRWLCESRDGDIDVAGGLHVYCGILMRLLLLVFEVASPVCESANRPRKPGAYGRSSKQVWHSDE